MDTDYKEKKQRPVKLPF
jgi:hypothetical protein